MTQLVATGARGLHVDALERRFEGFQLGPISLDLAPGKALGVLGSNGAGKTTLLAGLAGQATLHRGTVSWNGQPLAQAAWAHRHVVSYVRDIPMLYGELTVSQTMRFVARLQPTWSDARARDLLDRFALDHRRAVAVLSRGMKAKLSLLLATCHDVRLLLLDEVTAGVDADTRDDVQRFLRDLVAAHGVTIVSSSHIFEDIEHVSDDVLILRRGQPAFRGRTREPDDCVTATFPHDAPTAVAHSAQVVGQWRGYEGTTVLLRTPLAGDVEEALARATATVRTSTLRDLYFAFRERA
jgi:ABC-2 type transport system ATP-binding protein